jgi:hypothetical protein
MSDAYVLPAETFKFNELKRRLLVDHPDLDEETLNDTLEGATNLKEAIAAVIRSAIDDEALADALKSRFDTLKQRLNRIEDRAVAKRQAALHAMQAADMPKLLEPDFTASLRATGPSVIVMDEAAIPSPFWVEQRPKLDKRALLGVLASGENVPGATLSNGHVTLSVRVR